MSVAKLGWLVIVAALLAPPVGAWAQDQKDGCPDRRVHGKAGEWMLAISWQPAWCEVPGDECQRALPECMRPYHGGEALTLHGLWPQWGGYCDVPDSVIKNFCGNGRCAIARPDMSAETEKFLASIMPSSASRLDRHEWLKHGTCSAMTPDAYFRKAGDLVEAFRATHLGRLLADRVGQTVSRQEICDTFAKDVGKEGIGALEVSSKRHADKFYLTEIQIGLKAETGTALSLAPGTMLPKGENTCVTDKTRNHSYFIDPSGYQTFDKPKREKQFCR